MVNLPHKLTGINIFQITSIGLSIMLFAAALSLAVPSYNTSTAEGSVSDDSNCVDQMSSEMHQRGSEIDNEKAKSISTQNDEYVARTEGYEQIFNSVYNVWKFDMIGCHVSELQSVNVVHNLYDSNGNYVKNIVVTEDPSLSKVIEISEHVGAQYSHLQSLTNWAGYEFVANSFTWSTPPACTSVSDPDCVWQSRATWTQPSVSKPTDPSTACKTYLGYQPCNLAIWTGLEDDFNPPPVMNLVQAGSDAKITCTSSSNCPISYFFWYQIGASNQATICTGFSFVPGNGVQAIVTNQAKTGGSNTKYNLSVINTSTGVGCGVTGVTYTALPFPNVAAFINERARYNPPAYATLAKFSSDTMTGYLWYNGSEKGISTPYSPGWYNKIRMVNTVINMNYPTVSSNSMTFTWSTSANT